MAGLPADAVKRKQTPIASGVLDYFPNAIAAVAHVSWTGNNQHNPGTPLHWDRSKSTDESDALMRHFVERGTLDVDGMRHSAKVAWRALALLEKEIEAEKPVVDEGVMPVKWVTTKAGRKARYDIKTDTVIYYDETGVNDV